MKHVIGFWQAHRDAAYLESTFGLQKLLYADLVFPAVEDVIQRVDHRWRK